MKTEQNPFPLCWLPDRPRWLAWSLRLGLVALGAYVLLFTWVWFLLTDLAVMAVYDLSQLGIGDKARPGWYAVSQSDTFLRKICRFSNSVAEVTQPIVTDEEMIAHWRSHRIAWEAAISRFPQASSNPEDHRAFAIYIKSVGLDRAMNLPLRPGGSVMLIPPESLGRSFSPRVCLGRDGSRKYYQFFSAGVAPPPNAGATSLHQNAIGAESPSSTDELRIVQTTDGTPLKSGFTRRRLSEQWFISRFD